MSQTFVVDLFLLSKSLQEMLDTLSHYMIFFDKLKSVANGILFNI